jgi:predicted acylesterase/phospholipase RssA
VFVEADNELALYNSHVVDYVPTALADEHIRASAAIPVLFPPVRIETPAEARGWYVDGGTRLNTPIKPALDLGAERLLVIGTEAVWASEPAGTLHLTLNSVIDDTRTEPSVESVMLMVTTGSSPAVLGSARVIQAVRKTPAGWRVAARTISKQPSLG